MNMKMFVEERMKQMMTGNRIVLKASAGTGKTYRLSLEYISNLIKDVNFKNIVVMTFTKKATAEIKERIFDFLYQIAFDKGKGDELEKSLREIYGLENNLDKKKLQNIYFEMIKNKEEMRVFTIDSFTNQIFGNTIAPYFNIYNYEILDTEEDEFYEKILVKILSNDEHFEKFKFIFDEEKDKKNIDTYVEIVKNIISEQKNFVLYENRSGNEIIDDRKAQSCETRLSEILKNVFSRIEEYAESKGNPAAEYFHNDFQTAYREFIKMDAVILEEQADGTLEKKIEKERKKIKYLAENWEKLIPLKFYDGRKIKGKTNEELTELLKEEKEDFDKNLANWILYKKILPLDKKLKEAANLIYDIALKEKMSAKRFTHDDISVFTYKFIFDEKLKFVENDRVTPDFLDLIGGNIETVMIDEFQDTSILQWKILKLLINSSKNIICVGDEKQSIYNWRGGEKELFENLENLIEGKVENLTKSYRSYREIIENVNKIFGGYNEKWAYENVEYRDDEDYQKGYFSYFMQEKNSKNPEAENAKEKMVRDIKSGKIMKLGESCIICRTNSQLDDIVKKLNEEDIPYTLASNESILEHKAVKPLYKLMKYFIFDNFIYLLEFLRSDLIGSLNSHVKYMAENKDVIEGYLKNRNSGYSKDKEENAFGDRNQTFEEFAEGIEDGEVKRSILEYRKINTLERNNLVFSEILSKIRKLKNLSENLNSKQVKENFSKKIVQEFEVTKFYNTKSDIKNIFNFFNILKQHNDLFEFITFIEDEKDRIKQVSSTDANAVNLMTIHKSKGLEFDTVFYYKNKSNSVKKKDGVRSYFSYDRNFEKIETFLLAFSKFSKILDIADNYSGIVENGSFKEEMEEINADYVALTRAKKNLLLYFDVKVTREKGILDSLVRRLLNIYEGENEGEEIFTGRGGQCDGNHFSRGEITEKSDRTEDEGKNENSEKIDRIMDYFSDNVLKKAENIYGIDIEKELKRKKGLAIHYYFEHIINDIENDRKIARSSLLNRYGNLIGKEILSEIVEKMDNFINNNREIYDEKYKVYTEFEIYTTDENGKLRKNIIDRINIDEENKKIYIYDYKTGYEPLENKKYEEQIENYRKILSEKTGGEYEIFSRILEV